MEPWAAGQASWWQLPQIDPPTGPFWYAFNASLPVADPQVYLAFAFPGVQGWVQQNFFNVRPVAPPASVWALPALCRAPVPSCNITPGVHGF
jgi:hypothetical protein